MWRRIVLCGVVSFLGCEVAPPLPAPSASAPVQASAADRAAAPQALDVPTMRWSWVDVEGTRCADGQPTGMGVNLVPEAEELLIFMQGGGACWDGETCFTQRRSIHIERGYTQETFAGEGELGAPLFLRGEERNPFKGAIYVFVPYCTGDMHAGDRLASYEVGGAQRAVAHHGAKNIAAMVGRLRGAMPQLKRVWVVGLSAGGYGAQFNTHRFVEAWPGAEVHVLADGAPLVTPQAGGARVRGLRAGLSGAAAPPDDALPAQPLRAAGVRGGSGDRALLRLRE